MEEKLSVVTTQVKKTEGTMTSVVEIKLNSGCMAFADCSLWHKQQGLKVYEINLPKANLYRDKLSFYLTIDHK